jgi:hypothetical protein
MAAGTNSMQRQFFGGCRRKLHVAAISVKEKLVLVGLAPTSLKNKSVLSVHLL